MSQASGDEEMSQTEEEMPRGRHGISQSRREISQSHREISQSRREISQSRPEEEVDVKPKLNLLISHDGQEITVRVKANMPFRKIFDAAADRFKKEPGTLKFTFEGNRIHPKDTPGLLGMEDNDVIDANLEQLGGDSVSIRPQFF